MELPRLFAQVGYAACLYSGLEGACFSDLNVDIILNYKALAPLLHVPLAAH